MAEDKTVDTEHEYLDDGTKNPDFKKPEASGDEGDDSKSDKKDDNKPDEEGEDKDKDGDEPKFDDDATPVVPVKKSNAQFIIGRKNKKIEKLQSKSDDKDKEDPDLDDEPEDDDNLSEPAKDAISKEIDNRIKPIVETLVKSADENELKDLFTTTPDAKKYEKHIRAYMGHDLYKSVAPEVIYHHLAFHNALAIGAKKSKVADKEANLNKGGGRNLPSKDSVAGLPSAEDIAGMDDAEFQKMEDDARQGKFIKK